MKCNSESEGSKERLTKPYNWLLTRVEPLSLCLGIVHKKVAMEWISIKPNNKQFVSIESTHQGAKLQNSHGLRKS